MKSFKMKVASTLLLALTSASLSSLVYAKQNFDLSPPKDPGVINEERITYWLKKQGNLKKSASKAEIESALKSYKNRVSATNPDGNMTRPNIQIRGITTKQAAKTVKVLAVLIDFPDLPFDNNRLVSGDTGMYYDNYSVDHYRQLMFSTTGYTGPSGQNLMTAYQYYQQESGGEFFMTGDTFGWVTADNNSDYYGGNDPEDDDNDQAPGELIQEAVAKAVAANTIDLTEYDVEDPFDLDDDGNVSEPDGFIDHVNIFHSSVGEEAGGGVLADDAIWSHRFFVNPTGDKTTMGFAIPGSAIKLFGYTIQPIDAATGVVVHEFGHDLGLRDEYDIGSSTNGAPTGNWSVMAGGSWAGNLAGTEPVAFSSYAREKLQQLHGANWMNQTVIEMDTLNNTSQTINVVEAVEHATGINQIRINLPQIPVEPFTDNFQYHSGQGDNLTNEMSFELAVPTGTDVSLTMKARWTIEEDWDFVQVKINDQAIKGNVTTDSNPYDGQYPDYAGIVNYISGRSLSITGMADALSWADVSFDLAAYKGQTVTVTFYYFTDTNTGGRGFLADDLSLNVDGNVTFLDGAETSDFASLNGFSRIGNTLFEEKKNYWIQLRSFNEVDSGLATVGYDRGMLLWYSDENFSDNKVEDHAGYGFIGVVDADQNMIGLGSSSVQVRDAAFSQFTQSNYSGDRDLTANSKFDDSNDYSSPQQPQSGLVLPNLGLTIELVSQAADSSSASLLIAAAPIVISSSFTSSQEQRDVSFSSTSVGNSSLTYSWDFGDGSGLDARMAPSHSYTADGSYTVTLTATNVDGDSDISSQTITINTVPNALFSTSISSKTVIFTNTSTGGIGGLTYNWDFADGTTSAEQSPSHTYANDGSYSVVLTITDSEDRESTSTVNVTISSAATGGGSTSSSGGGGSLAWLSLFLLSGFLTRRK